MEIIHILFVLLLSRLQVISTKVGGVPEVLPQDMIKLVEPNVSGWPHCYVRLIGFKAPLTALRLRPTGKLAVT